MGQHAFLSASGAPAWSRCEIKPWREKGLPDETSIYAEEGTQAHAQLENWILHDTMPEADIQPTLDLIDSIVLDNPRCAVLPEQKLDISFVTGETNSKGTADVVICTGTELIIIDLKYGMGVQVEAGGNEQLLLYGVAALEHYDLLGEIKTLKMVISQPRLRHTSEWVVSTKEAYNRAEDLGGIAKRILAAKGGDTYLRAVPGEKQCRFCKAKSVCPEYRGFVLQTVTGDFEDLSEKQQFLDRIENSTLSLPDFDDTRLATCMEAAGMIETWCKGVRSEVFKRLSNRTFTDPRFKIAQGKKGHRKWGDPKSVMDLAIAHGVLDLVTEIDLKSPAQLEKILGKTEFWAEAKSNMVQNQGSPTVVPVSDKREPLILTLDFTPIEKQDD